MELAEQHSFFNSRLLTEDLKIPKDTSYLLLEFCAARPMASELLKKENKMQLLDHFVLSSQLFLIILEDLSEIKKAID